MNTESIFAKAYACYPRHVALRAAEKAWKAAIKRRKAKHSIPQAEDFIYQRVMTFAAVCERIHKPKEFIPHMATWLNQSRFLDDPSEWAVTNGNGHHQEPHDPCRAQDPTAEDIEYYRRQNQKCAQSKLNPTQSRGRRRGSYGLNF